MWNGVKDLIFVSPPVSKCRTARAMFGNFIRDFVALEHMLKCANSNAKTFHQANQGEDFVLPIRVTVDQTLSLKNFADRFQFQIPSGSQAAAFCRFFLLSQIMLRGGKSVGDERPHAHAGLRKSGRVSLAPIVLLDVFAQSEFDAWRSGFELQLIRSRAIAKLYHTILAADRIGRAMQ